MSSSKSLVSADAPGLTSTMSTALRTMRPIFPDWEDDDLVSVLLDSNGDVEMASSKILEGLVPRWFDNKTKSVKRTEVKSMFQKRDFVESDYKNTKGTSYLRNNFYRSESSAWSKSNQLKEKSQKQRNQSPKSEKIDSGLEFAPIEEVETKTLNIENSQPIENKSIDVCPIINKENAKIGWNGFNCYRDDKEEDRRNGLIRGTWNTPPYRIVSNVESVASIKMARGRSPKANSNKKKPIEESVINNARPNTPQKDYQSIPATKIEIPSFSIPIVSNSAYPIDQMASLSIKNSSSRRNVAPLDIRNEKGIQRTSKSCDRPFSTENIINQPTLPLNFIAPPPPSMNRAIRNQSQMSQKMHRQSFVPADSCQYYIPPANLKYQIPFNEQIDPQLNVKMVGTQIISPYHEIQRSTRNAQNTKEQSDPNDQHIHMHHIGMHKRVDVCNSQKTQGIDKNQHNPPHAVPVGYSQVYPYPMHGYTAYQFKLNERLSQESNVTKSNSNQPARPVRFSSNQINMHHRPSNDFDAPTQNFNCSPRFWPQGSQSEEFQQRNQILWNGPQQPASQPKDSDYWRNQR